jgi:NTP pyrophosphatase (non-canonical NTP hydrolase)
MPIEEIKHEEMVATLLKSGDTLLQEMTADDMHLLHMGAGIVGEAGELICAIKDNTIWRKTLDLENIIEELGDLEFYMEGLRRHLGLTREQCLEANIKKLSKRYKGFKYSNEAAQFRADKR